MKFRVTPTRVQWVMAVIMMIVFVLLSIWLVPEIMGVIDPAAEDTYSEIVFDLPWGWVLAVAFLHLAVGVAFVWSAGHFIEGYKRRRDIERD